MSSYAGNASQHAEEIRESLSEEDIDTLRADVETLGVDGWLDWCAEHEQEALKYLSATPKQREKRKAWQEPVLRRRLCFFAYRLARIAAAVLDAVPYLGPGGGYRDTSGAAANRGLDIISEGEWRWPFGGEPPSGWPGPKKTYYKSIFVAPGQEPIVREGYTFD